MDTKEKLDMLAEFHSQRDSIEAQKRALLDEVKIPDEIIEIQRQANAEAGKVDNGYHAALETVRQECRRQLESIIIPDEIKALLAEIDRQREEVEAHRRKKEIELQSANTARKQAIFENTESKTRQVYDDIASRKRDIESEFAGKLDDVSKNIAKLESEIKAEVKAGGQSVKGKYFHAVYVKGRVSWNTDMLDGMIALVPQLSQARKEGEPSITLRKI